MTDIPRPDLTSIAAYLRDILADRSQRRPGKSPFILIYAFNATGKTRLSMAFKDLGKGFAEDGETPKRDTLYFNAFTEDLFRWDNDLAADQQRVLELNDDSSFFTGLRQLEMDVKVGELLNRYADFNFYILYDRTKSVEKRDGSGREDVPLPPAVIFFRERDADNNPIPIKISRGEENIFIWCFFLAFLQLALDGDPAYEWVEHVYIDDPISSLDEHNAIVVGNPPRSQRSQTFRYRPHGL